MSKKYTKEELEVLSIEELYGLSGLSIQTVNDVNPIETRTLNQCESLPFDDGSFTQLEYELCYGQDVFDFMTNNSGLNTFKISDIVGPNRVNEHTELLVILFSTPW
tara:strand:- start:84 stop:401 length:318 start_codon:yes stop_codon:yes gene_type:complete